MYRILVLLLLLYSCSVHATWLDIHLTSVHQYSTYEHNNIDKPINQNNFGIGLSFKYSQSIDIAVGYYRNSIDHPSTYVGGSIHTSNKYLNFNVCMGLVTGYEELDRIGLIVPIILPGISVTYNRVKLRVGIIPVGGNPALTFTTSLLFK